MFERMPSPKGLELPASYFEAVSIQVGAERLTGIKVAEDLTKDSDFVFLHGAGGGNWSRLMTFARPVVEQGSSIIAFDHSGHGTSTGDLKKASLQKRLREAEAIVDEFTGGAPRTICGSSMGGYIAIKLLEKYSVENLILYCPAVYDVQAFDADFDSGFTEIIRRPQSWRDSDAFAILEGFTGKILVVIGSEDEVIPQEIITLLDQHSHSASKKEILVIPGSPHAIHGWLLEHPTWAHEVAKKVATFSQ